MTVPSGSFPNSDFAMAARWESTREVLLFAIVILEYPRTITNAETQNLLQKRISILPEPGRRRKVWHVLAGCTTKQIESRVICAIGRKKVAYVCAQSDSRRERRAQGFSGEKGAWSLTRRE